MDSFMKAHAGTYGMGVQKTLDEVFWLGSAFNAKAKIWIDGPDGSIVYGSVQPEMKPLIAKWAEWYKKGYLRKDFMSIDNQALVGDIAAGKLGTHFYTNWAGWVYVDAVKALGMDAHMVPFEIPTVDGKPGIHPIAFDNDSYIVVNKNAKNIPAILKCISFVSWIAMEATSQGILTDAQVDRYLLKGEGRHTMLPIELNDPYGNGPAMVEWAHKVGLNNYQITEPAMTSEWKAQYDQAAPWWKDKSVEGYGRWIQQYYPGASGWLNLQVIKQNRWVATKLTGAMPAEGAAYGTTLDDLLVEGFTKIIAGEQPLSFFDTVVAQWKSSGGDVTTKAVNKVYGKK
jgi:putative aldouronate transport system substrate-binding protein